VVITYNWFVLQIQPVYLGQVDKEQAYGGNILFFTFPADRKIEFEIKLIFIYCKVWQMYKSEWKILPFLVLGSTSTGTFSVILSFLNLNIHNKELWYIVNTIRILIYGSSQGLCLYVYCLHKLIYVIFYFMLT